MEEGVTMSVPVNDRAKNIFDWPGNLRVDVSGTQVFNKTIYIGYADNNSNTGSPQWLVSRTQVSGTSVNHKEIDRQFASGNVTFNKIWDDHRTSPYS